MLQVRLLDNWFKFNLRFLKVLGLDSGEDVGGAGAGEEELGNSGELDPWELVDGTAESVESRLSVADILQPIRDQK